MFIFEKTFLKFRTYPKRRMRKSSFSVWVTPSSVGVWSQGASRWSQPILYCYCRSPYQLGRSFYSENIYFILFSSTSPIQRIISQNRLLKKRTTTRMWIVGLLVVLMCAFHTISQPYNLADKTCCGGIYNAAAGGGKVWLEIQDLSISNDFHNLV